MAVIDPPDYVERICVAGSNGSGKSVFIRELLNAGYPRWVVVDIKGSFHPIQPAKEYVVVHDPHSRELLTGDRVLYRPAHVFKNRKWYEYLFEVLLRRAEFYGPRGKPFIVVVDEGLALSRSRGVLNLGNLAVTGRELGVGLWVLSQRCKWIPVEVKSEAWRWYVFYLGDEEDEVEILKFAKGELTLDELRAATHSHRFVELRRGAESGGRVQVRALGKVHPTTSREVLVK